MNKILLFSYGTLADPEYIQLLLKRLPGYTEATLKAYAPFIHPEHGYLFVKPSPLQVVKGKLFEVDERELRLIDRWEGVPDYQRELLDVHCGGSVVKAFVYTQNQTKGLPAENGRKHERSAVIRDIEAFLRWIEKNPID